MSYMAPQQYFGPSPISEQASCMLPTVLSPASIGSSHPAQILRAMGVLLPQQLLLRPSLQQQAPGNQLLLAGTVALVVPVVATDAALAGASRDRARPTVVAVLATCRAGTGAACAHRRVSEVVWGCKPRAQPRWLVAVSLRKGDRQTAALRRPWKLSAWVPPATIKHSPACMTASRERRLPGQRPSPTSSSRLVADRTNLRMFAGPKALRRGR